MSDSDDLQDQHETKNSPDDRKGNWKSIRDRKRQIKEWKKQKLLKSLERRLKAEKETASLEKSSKKMKTDDHDLHEKRQVPTVSIAVPGSILDNAQCAELRTLLAGQVARAASISCVDEVIVYDETGTSTISEFTNEFTSFSEKHSNCNLQMAHILRYLECPQYLRKYFFPLHKDLKHAGLLPPLDCPHHLRESDASEFREGVVVERPVKNGHGSFVNVGLHKDVQLDKQLEAGLRVTVRLSDLGENKKRHRGQAVDSTTPRSEKGMHWGYSVRLATNLGAVFSQCPYPGGYDLTVGTSDKGDSVDHLSISPFRHLLIVFGGVKGLEYALDCDETLTADDPRDLFQSYINTFPGQGSRTIRTEEAILLTMAVLRPKIKHHTRAPQ